MPRIRTIKPDFWDSPDTAAADLRTRLLYIAMWNWANDYGIGDATPVRLIGFAFPNDDIPASDYPRILADLPRNFAVVFFHYRGRPFYVIREWEKHQRTEKKARVDEGLLAAAQEALDAPISAGQDTKSDYPRNSADGPRDSADVPATEVGNRKLEVEKKETAKAVSKESRSVRGARLPDGWRPAPEVCAQMRSDHPKIDLEWELAKFIDHWQGQAGQNARKANWDATWRNWIRRESERRAPRNGSPISRTDEKIAGWQAVTEQLIAEMTPPRMEELPQ